MKKTATSVWGFGALLAFSMAAHAGQREDYAQQWVLSLPSAEGGIYQLPLSREVYQTLQSPQLLDMEIFNAQGQALPAALLSPTFEVETSSRTLSLPWFALPQSPQAKEGDDVSLWVVSNPDGSVKLLNIQTPPEKVVAPSSWLIDASALREPLRTLTLDWAEDAGPFEQYVDVECSDDLRQWRLLVSRAPLLNLSKERQALRHNRMELNSRCRYLRLKLKEAQPELPLTGVYADVISQVALPQNWQWKDLQGRRREERGQSTFEFELRGRFPMERVDVLSENNTTQRWLLQSRDTPEGVWRTRAEAWVAYVVQMTGTEIRSSIQPLNGVCRDRYWRLVLDALPGNFAVPTLRLFYRPEVLVFMLQGEAPYALAAGSTQAERMSSSLLHTLEALRQQRGEAWQPVTAGMGPVEILAGDAALKPVPKEVKPASQARHWKTWLLWGVLVAGAVLVVGFALSMLKGNRGKESPPD